MRPLKTAGAPAAGRVEELKTSGLKATLPRLKVLEVFQRSGERHLATYALGFL